MLAKIFTTMDTLCVVGKNLDSLSHVKDKSVSTYKQINVIFFPPLKQITHA